MNQEINEIRQFLKRPDGSILLGNWKEYRGWLVTAKWSNRYGRSFIHAERRVDTIIQDEKGQILKVIKNGSYRKMKENFDGEWTEYE